MTLTARTRTRTAAPTPVVSGTVQWRTEQLDAMSVALKMLPQSFAYVGKISLRYNPQGYGTPKKGAKMGRLAMNIGNQITWAPGAFASLEEAQAWLTPARVVTLREVKTMRQLLKVA